MQDATLLWMQTHVWSLGANDRERLLQTQFPVLDQERDHDNGAASTPGFAVHVGRVAINVHLCVDKLHAPSGFMTQRE